MDHLQISWSMKRIQGVKESRIRAKCWNWKDSRGQGVKWLSSVHLNPSTLESWNPFFIIAYGSNCELETQIMLSGDLGYIDSDILEGIKDDIHEVERMLKALIKSLENKHLNPRILGPFLPTNWEKNPDNKFWYFWDYNYEGNTTNRKRNDAVWSAQF